MRLICKLRRIFYGLKAAGAAVDRVSQPGAPPNAAGQRIRRARLEISFLNVLDPQTPSGYIPAPSRAGCLRKIRKNAVGKPVLRALDARLRDFPSVLRKFGPGKSLASGFWVSLIPCGRTGMKTRNKNADSQPAYSQAARRQAEAQQGSGPPELPSKARSLHARLYDDAEEAELGAAQGREGAPDQRLRSAHLYSGRGSQSSGTQCGPDPRRPRQGASRRSLSQQPRRARHAGRQGPQEAPFALRHQASEVRRSRCHAATAQSAAKSTRMPSLAIWCLPSS